MYLNNQLYVRSESNKPKPFVRINTESLEEEKEEVELEKEDQNLEWKENEETGRSLTYTPLFSDGQYIYVISRRKAPKKKNGKNIEIISIEEGKEHEEEAQGEKKDKPPQLVVEIYDPQTPSFKFVREIFLYKNADFEPFIKKQNEVDFLKDSSFITNGQLLMI